MPTLAPSVADASAADTDASAADTDAATPAPTARPTRHPAIPLAAMTAGLGAILVVLLALFILPSLKSGAHDLGIGVVGRPEAVSQTEETLATLRPGDYATRQFDSADELADAIEAREVVGGLVVTRDGVQAMVASAGSTAISGTLTGTAQLLGGASGLPVTITDVVPLPASDPSGIGIGGLAFPLVFGGIVPVVAFRSAFPRHHSWRLAGILLFSVVGGSLVAAVLQLWFGSVTAAFWPVAGSMALGIAALGVPLAGLQELWGGKGFTIGAMSMMFLGNPLAGIATTGAWLPAGLGAFGQMLPPGATGALVRSAAYFGGAGGLTPALTLATWVLAGVVLNTLGYRRTVCAEAENPDGAVTA